MGMRPAIFIDRDGVLCENRIDYVKNFVELDVFPFALDAMKYLKKLDAYIFMITNQSAVGRGLMSLAMADDINDVLVKMIQLERGRIDKVYVCYHAPEDGCLCRKPLPGLVRQALRDYPDIDVNRMAFIGDQMTDMIKFNGIKSSYFLVTSGLPIAPASIKNMDVVIAENILELTTMMANGRMYTAKQKMQGV